ncbi:inositol monophosphatase family protein [Nocardioides sp. CFH 31398]|uniref:inositol monophosphatase family protein n=1 Tax=Nocardioides sp. CFH 31398 TaxID=2919579 RepID=UPI001F0600C2|nr:inositol monophosphatase family protein [Nocardioides sp. CFH 31398]MCH1866426.1 inositol monophosphatase family protein [Nocardioides sp. CFH 31398]
MDTDAVLDLVVDVAARVITPRFRALDDAEVSEKNPGDLVTVADREAEVELTAALTAAYPDAVVLGEEAYAGDPALLGRFTAAARSGHAFTVDPVDGTKNFVHGSPDHAVMVAELRDGLVTRAWIHQPQHRRSYVAERGAGTWRDGERLTVPDPGEETEAWLPVTSKRRWRGRGLPGLRPFELTWVCCGLDYPSLIEGKATVALYGNGAPWDHAPGSLLVTEAGGATGGADGTPYDPTRAHLLDEHGPLVVAASPAVHAVVAPLAGSLVDP